MKYIYKIIFPYFFLVGCLNESPTENNFNKYNGTWIWLKTVGGIGPRVFEPEDGITTKIRYDGYKIFKILRNDTLKVIGHYKIDEAENGYDIILYSDIITYNYRYDVDSEFAQISSDSLVVWDGAFDGYFSFYKKIH